MQLSLAFFLTAYALSFLALFTGILLLVVSNTRDTVHEGVVMHVSPRPQFSDHMVVVSYTNGKGNQEAFYFTTTEPDKYPYGAKIQWRSKATTGLTIAGSVLVSVATFALISSAVLHMVQSWSLPVAVTPTK